ncbi:NUDIX domain-containing protein [uncultured Demequina sp.]|uniref:NUDIX domain-containing protein n=1 Tax=uncultured Demequina sp. TaxID=693499 RepID=UPI00345BF459
MVHDPHRGVLLQHRALWSHHGGTWGIPGGALHEGESAIDGAFREAAEEASVPSGAIRAVATVVDDRSVWRYTTVIARAAQSFTPAPADAESLELRWVPVEKVGELPLHPAFHAAWPQLVTMLEVRPRMIVDMANVVGSRPDGWWKDRRAASTRLGDRLGRLHRLGSAASDLALPGERWFPAIEAIIEGGARGAAMPAVIDVTEAPGEGDATLVLRVESSVEHGEHVTVVTSDRLLAARVTGAGARTWPSGRLWALLDDLGSGD